jgi:hypothetical protein
LTRGATTNQKNKVTRSSRHAAIVTMMARSLANTELLTTSSDKAVADPSHGPDEERLLRIIAKLLAQSTNQDVD